MGDFCYELQHVPPAIDNSETATDYDQAQLVYQREQVEISDASKASWSTRGIASSKAFKVFNQPKGWTYGRIQGWRRSVVVAMITTSLIFVINFSFLVIASVKSKPEAGIGTLYSGNCNVVRNWDTALPLVINVLGTCLLAACNFTMQCIKSPTRSEIDAAHAKRKSLDIGISSIHNLLHLKKWKVALWFCLCLSTIPLHLLWNSTVFSTFASNEFAYIVVDENVFDGKNIPIPIDNCGEFGLPNDSNLNAIYASYKAGNFRNISIPDLLSSYDTLVVTRRNVIAVTRPEQGMRMAPGCASSRNEVNLTSYYDLEATPPPHQLDTVVEGYPQPLWNGSSVLGINDINAMQDVGSFLPWLCAGFEEYQVNPLLWNNCDQTGALSLFQSNGTYYLSPLDINAQSWVPYQSFPIDHFLSEEPGPERCTLQYVSSMLCIVVACNSMKLICMALTLRYLYKSDEPILATIGDAVMSYIEQPDQTTRNWCLLDFTKMRYWKTTKPEMMDKGMYTRASSVRLFNATTKLRWFTTVILSACFLSLGSWLLATSVWWVGGYYDSLLDLWKQGLGNVNVQNVMNIPALSSNTANGIILDIIFANSFQFVLSITYFLYNSLYTAQWGALEWSKYGNRKRIPLRVVCPNGQQKSTYWLQLPYRYSVPLAAISMLLHFLISQSVFLIRIQWYDHEDNPDPNRLISNVGFSPVGILGSVCVGGFLILVQIIHSFRRLDNVIPIHGNQSAVISAMCHSYADNQESKSYSNNVYSENIPVNDSKISTQLVMWGTIKQARNISDIGHCGFTAEDVEMPIRGRQYR